MADLFKEIIPSILQTKTDCLVDEKDYVPFVVNKSVSFHYDCILYANQMNLLPHTDKRLQYDFYLHSLRKYKRGYKEWMKNTPSRDLSVAKEYYKYSDEKAKEILKVLTREQLDDLEKRLHKGGIKNARPKQSNMGDTS